VARPGASIGMQAMINVDRAQCELKRRAQRDTSMQEHMGIATTAVGDPEPRRARVLAEDGAQAIGRERGHLLITL